ncbi:helix-turn-helix transcriptional regulator [Nocardia sp. CA-128927]|uniref:helix-turn-helix transcriptional regulator n=1 Tax=Nocardia sp. CA-128927 TaxID=3239975 RepID=UPI003D9523D9
MAHDHETRTGRHCVYGRRWYLIGWDVDRADWRTYRADRLHPPIPTGPRFTPREAPDVDLSGYLSRGVTSSPYRYSARITLGVSVEVAADRIAPTVGVIEAVDAETCVLQTGSDSLDELAIYVAGFGFPFRVHEPAELITHVRELSARLAESVE